MLLGDAAGLLKEVAKKTTLRVAFHYAHRDRLKEWFYDPFELEWAALNESAIVNELAEELKDPLNYQFQPAYAYFTPKTELSCRRMIYIPFQGPCGPLCLRHRGRRPRGPGSFAKMFCQPSRS
jgi:hypothetical protein